MLRNTFPGILIVLLAAAACWAIVARPRTQPEAAKAPATHAARLGSDSSQSRAAEAAGSGGTVRIVRRRPPGRAAAGRTSPDAGIAWAKEALPAIENVKDYSALFVKRERVDGKLGVRQSLFIKVRHKPFSVYARGLAPAAIKGQEAIYVAGRNQGKLWAHPAGLQGRFVHALALKPDGMMAMREQRYPITEIGVLNMVKHMIAVAEQDIQHDDCEVRFFRGGKINDRACTWCQVVHPIPRQCFHFHLVRIFVDDELKFSNT